MRPVYFDTSVFLAIFNGEPEAKQIRQLLQELRRDNAKIYTSIVTIQEVSVASFNHGNKGDENHSKVSKLARVTGITRDMALRAARLECALLKSIKPDSDTARVTENRRRKWDCFHIGTAIESGCDILYASDQKLLNRRTPLKGLIGGLRLLPPKPDKPTLFADEKRSKKKHVTK